MKKATRGVGGCFSGECRIWDGNDSGRPAPRAAPIVELRRCPKRLSCRFVEPFGFSPVQFASITNEKGHPMGGLFHLQ